MGNEADDLFAMFMEAGSNDRVNDHDYIRAPFGWPGGKFKSLQHIIPRLGRGTILNDCCGGSGVITINAPSSYSLKVFNDRHSGVVAFFRCLKDPEKVGRLVDWLSLTPHSREDFVWCHDSWENVTDDVERAARWYYMLRISFSQLGRNFGRTLKGPNQLAKKLYSDLEHLWVIHERIIGENVQIENRDCVLNMREYDSFTTDHYVDPDYLGTDPGIYEHRVDHQLLLKAVFEMQGQVFVSGYRSELYDSYPWDEIQTWDVMVSTKAQAFNERNHLAHKEGFMDRSRKAQEVLYIKHAA